MWYVTRVRNNYALLDNIRGGYDHFEILLNFKSLMKFYTEKVYTGHTGSRPTNGRVGR